MAANKTSRMSEILARHEKDVLEDWLRMQIAAITLRRDLISDADLRRQSGEFLTLLITACRSGKLTGITTPEWAPARDLLAGLSRSRATQAYTPSETATFIFSLKKPLFARLRQELAKDAAALADEMWAVTVLLDKLGLYTTEVFQQGREELIKRQQAESPSLISPAFRPWIPWWPNTCSRRWPQRGSWAPSASRWTCTTAWR